MAETVFRVAIQRIVTDPTTPDLSLRQLAVLLILRDEPKADCTVRGMAATLNISKPAITRAADRLEDLNLAAREPDKMDRRSVFVRLTRTGRKFAAQLPGSSTLAEAA